MLAAQSAVYITEQQEFLFSLQITQKLQKYLHHEIIRFPVFLRLCGHIKVISMSIIILCNNFNVDM